MNDLKSQWNHKKSFLDVCSLQTLLCECVSEGSILMFQAAKIILKIVTCAYDINAQCSLSTTTITIDMRSKPSTNSNDEADYKFWYIGLNCSFFNDFCGGIGGEDFELYSKLI